MPCPLSEISGNVFDIQPYSIHDGPGIRTTVFMKGCPLHCVWCQNPESQSARPEEIRDTDGTTRVVGRKMTAGEVFDEIKKDAIFYRRSGGGITLSGGEPLAQPRFAEAILTLCRDAGFHTALDTTGYGKWSSIHRVFEFCNLVLFDLKHFDSEKHRTLTGVGNAQILDNLRQIRDLDLDLWIRIPVVPGMNDNDEHLESVTTFLTRELSNAHVFLLPYHQLGEGKYEALGRTALRIDPPTNERMATIRDRMQAAGLTVQIGG